MGSSKISSIWMALYQQSSIHKTQLQYRESSNVTDYGIMLEEDVCLHLLHNHCFHFNLKRRVLPPLRCVTPRLHPHYTAGHRVVEPLKDTPDPGGHHPGLQFKQEGHLNDCLVKCAGGPGVEPLPPKNTGEPFPFTLGIPQIVDHHCKVVVGSGQEPPKVYKKGHHLQMPPIEQKGRCHA